VTTDPPIVELLLREGGDSPLLHRWYGMVVIIRMQMALFNYRRRAEYVLQQTVAMRKRMDAVDGR
jgi:hypothetical protein